MLYANLNTWGGPMAEVIAEAAIPRDVFGKPSIKAIAGWGGVIISDDDVDPVDLARAYVTKAAEESCGVCTPCRLGTAQMRAILERICDGMGQAGDIAELSRMADFIAESSRCDIGRTLGKPLGDLFEQCAERFNEVIDGGLKVPRGQYAATVTAPCIAACPSNVDVPGYLEAVQRGNLDEGLEIIKRDCPMPGTVGRVCVRPCESACRRGLVDEPIAIKAVKRYLADRATAPKPPADAANGAKVAVVGAGPAGLSAAHYLGLRGYATTVFEASDRPGGMAVWGIPAYRLPRDILAAEAAELLSNSELRTGVKVGKDIKLDELAAQGYAAIFLAMGAPQSSAMRCEGEDACYMGFMPGIDFLARAAAGQRPLDGTRVAVIGGGNVAMDCVRTSRRLGFDDVQLVYRRTEAEMPADQVEIDEAREEGVQFRLLTQPVRILAENGRVSGLECLRMELGEPDASGRRRPVPVAGSEFVIECDAVIPAVGQVCSVDMVISQNGTVSRRNTLMVDEMTFQSRRPEIFGGGDCATGPSSLIAALAAGKKAAAFIDKFITDGGAWPSGQDLLNRLVRLSGALDADESPGYHGYDHRAEPLTEDPDSRVTDFSEVERALGDAEALREAKRCLRCYRVAVAAL